MEDASRKYFKEDYDMNRHGSLLCDENGELCTSTLDYESRCYLRFEEDCSSEEGSEEDLEEELDQQQQQSIE